MYTKEDLTPVNEKEEMLVMALLRKCRGHGIDIMDGDVAIKSLNRSTIRIDTEYKKPAPKKLNIPWEFIKDEFICAAMDKNESIWLYSIVPVKLSAVWGKGGIPEEITPAFNVDADDVYWEESLIFRKGG